jgi:hypothetical protein
MLVTPLGIAILVRLVQSLNAPKPMLVTLSGIVMLARLVQSSNAHLPMLVTPLGIVMLVRLIHPSNTFCSITSTSLGIVTFFKLVQPLKVYKGMKIGQVTFWKIYGKRDVTYENGKYNSFSNPHISMFYKEVNNDIIGD